MKLFRSNVAKNAGWLIAGKVMQSFLALVINIITARYLGPSDYGIISYAASIVAFVVPIMELGFSNILVQEFTNHPEEEGKIVGTSIVLSACSALACIAGVAAYTYFVDAGETVTNLVVILYSLLLLSQAFELIQYWYQYKLMSKDMSIVSLIAYFAVSVYKVVLLATGKSVYWFAISNSIDYILIAIALLVIYKKKGGMKLSFDPNVGKRMFSSSKHYIVSSLMVTVFAQTDKIMIKLMIGEAHVGYYSAAVTCAGITSFVFSAIIDSFRPVIFKDRKNGDLSAYDQNLIRLNSGVIYLSFLQSIVMCALAPIIINILYGEEFAAAALALRIVVWYTTFSYLGSVRNIWILAENKQKFLWLLNLCGALLNVGLNFALIPLWGIYGAAAASLITQIFTNIVMNRIVYPLKHNNYYIFKALNPKVLMDLIRK